MITLIAFVFLLGVLIFVHELGHFLMARRLGIRVITFSLGFGPKILKFRRGETEYCISAVPLGGYVKMAGESLGDASAGGADEFLSRSKWDRFQVLVMGPVMNVVLAFVLTAGVFTFSGAAVPYVVEVAPGSPAQSAGVKPGDLVMSVDGRPVASQRQVVEAISHRSGRRMTLAVTRDGRTVELSPVAGANGRIGVAVGETLRLPGLVGAAKLAVATNVEQSGLIVRTLAGLFTRQTSPSELTGPIGIARLSGEYAEAGLRPYLLLMALISLNLGLMNLLPIPVLDGGHIFILAIEGVGRRDLSKKVKQRMLLAGFAVLLLLMATVVYNDLTHIQSVERLMFWR